MEKQETFTLKIESGLKSEFIAAAGAANRPASQLVRELMRDFIIKQREESKYKEFVKANVEAGLKDFAEGRYRTSEEVEAFFKAKCKALGGK